MHGSDAGIGLENIMDVDAGSIKESCLGLVVVGLLDGLAVADGAILAESGILAINTKLRSFLRDLERSGCADNPLAIPVGNIG